MRHHLDGPLGMLAGFSLFSFIPVLVKRASEWGAGAPVAVLVRFIVGLLCILVMMTLAGWKLRTGNRGILVLRGLFGGTAVMFFFIGVTHTGAGMGTLLNYTHSVWGNLLAVVVLRERPLSGHQSGSSVRPARRLLGRSRRAAVGPAGRRRDPVHQAAPGDRQRADDLPELRGGRLAGVDRRSRPGPASR